MTERSKAEQIIDNCLRIDEYLKTLQKSLVFDEQDVESFENTYHSLLNDLIATNWKNHDIAEKINLDDFTRIVK